MFEEALIEWLLAEPPSRPHKFLAHSSEDNHMMILQPRPEFGVPGRAGGSGRMGAQRRFRPTERPHQQIKKHSSCHSKGDKGGGLGENVL